MNALQHPRVAEQADELKRLLAAPHEQQGSPNGVIAVVGAKGGVGASAAALSLAHELAGSGDRAVVVDAHLGRGDLAELVALKERRPMAAPRRGGRWHDSPRGAGEPMSEPIGERLTLLRGWRGAEPGHEEHAAYAGRLRAAVREVANGAWAVIDAGVATSAWAGRVAWLADRLVLVATPTPLSCVAALAALRVLADAGGGDKRLGLLIAQAESAESAAAAAEALQRGAGETFAVDLLGWTPPVSVAGGEIARRDWPTPTEVSAKRAA